MGKKKILIASFFTAILLLIPFTAVSGTPVKIINLFEKSNNITVEESDSVKLYSSYMEKIEDLRNLQINEMKNEAQKILDSIKKDYGYDPEINALYTEITETLYITSDGKDLALCSKEELIQETQRRIDITMQKCGDNLQIATMCTEFSNIITTSNSALICDLIDGFWEFLRLFDITDFSTMVWVLIILFNLFIGMPLEILYYIFCGPRNLNSLDNIFIQETTNDCRCLKDVEINPIKTGTLLKTSITKISILTNLLKPAIFQNPSQNIATNPIKQMAPQKQQIQTFQIQLTPTLFQKLVINTN